MLPRIAQSAKVLAMLSRNNVAQQAVRCYSGGHHKSLAELHQEYKVTINDLPVPQGSWQEAYQKQNARWNMHLAANVVFFVVTIAAMQAGGVFLFHDAPNFKKIDVDAYKPLD